MQKKVVTCLVMGLLFFSGFTTACGAPDVSFRQGEGRLEIFVGVKNIATYVWQDENLPRPYFCDVIAPNGTQVTRNYPPDPVKDKDNSDHSTYHPGMWLAFGDINEADFWRNRARVKHAGFAQAPQGGEGMGSFAIINEYERTEGSPPIVCEERCTYSIHATELGYLIVSESEFRGNDGPIAFGDQEEMGFGVRMATGLTVRHGKGSILNSEGGMDEKGTWGKQAAWCAGFKNTNGVFAGMMVMADPENFRPSWFHSRDYGLIVANPFGKKAMTGPKDKSILPDSTPVKPGEAFSVGFGVYVFSLPGTEPPNLDPLYSDFLERIRVSSVRPFSRGNAYKEK